MPPQLADYAAGLLAQWIDASREQALQNGAQPMPPQIYRALRDWFPPSLLAGVRYSLAPTAQFSLPSLAFQYGDAAALTLGNVILFRNAQAAQSDTKLWAHELTHVTQYQRWGLQGFAARYVRDSNAVEHEAYANADRYAAAHGRLP